MFATGFRHPIGLGMSPTGILTGADQEGNWMPATRIDEYKKGGFYGDMRAHHRKEPPKTYDPPLCWLPREVDNSAGGQVWVPEKTFGPLAGLPLHLSYGRCKAFVLLRQECANGVVQGGVADLGLKFLSGVCRGRFGAGRPSLRLRPERLADGGAGRRLPAARALHRQAARRAGEDGSRWERGPAHLQPRARREERRERRATTRPRGGTTAGAATYGSKRWKVSDPKAEGQDEFAAAVREAARRWPNGGTSASRSCNP